MTIAYGSATEGRRIPHYVMVPASVFMTFLFCGGLGLLVAGVFTKSAHEFIYGASAVTAGLLWLRRERRQRLMKWSHGTFLLCCAAWLSMAALAWKQGLSNISERYLLLFGATAVCWAGFKVLWGRRRQRNAPSAATA